MRPSTTFTESEYDDASDEEPPGVVVNRCTSENVIKCAKPKFRELIVPESANSQLS